MGYIVLEKRISKFTVALKNIPSKIVLCNNIIHLSHNNSISHRAFLVNQ